METRLILIFLISFNCFSQNAIKIKKGEKASFSGALVKEETLDRLIKSDKKVLVLEQLRLIDEQKVDIYKDRLLNTEKELSKSNRRKFWSNIGYFTLGVIITGLAAKTAIESAR